jgi:hypothetical protein
MVRKQVEEYERLVREQAESLLGKLRVFNPVLKDWIILVIACI